MGIQSNQVNVRLKDELHLQVLRKATDLGVSVQQYIRGLIVADLQGKSAGGRGPGGVGRDGASALAIELGTEMAKPILKALDAYHQEEVARIQAREARTREVEQERERIIGVVRNQYTKICDKLGIKQSAKS